MVLSDGADVMMGSSQVVVRLPGTELVWGLVEVSEDDGGAARDHFREMPARDRIHDVLARVFSISSSG